MVLAKMLGDLLGPEKSWWDKHGEQVVIVVVAVFLLALIAFVTFRKKFLAIAAKRKQRKTALKHIKATRRVILTGIEETRVKLGDTYFPPLPEKPGYSFGGWFVDSALTVPWLSTQPVTCDMTLYPKWVKD